MDRLLPNGILVSLVRLIPGDGEPVFAEASNIISEVVTLLVSSDNSLNGLDSLSVEDINFTNVVSLDIRDGLLSNVDLFVKILLTVLNQNFKLVVIRFLNLCDLFVSGFS